MKKILSSGTDLQNGIYRIEKHLGGGGFGITYLATWIQGQQTKLKFIKTGEKTVIIKEFFYDEYCKRSNHSNEILIMDGQKSLEFERLRKKLVSEANILNSFKHPHIVEVFDVFEENNTAYIVMEYVEGEDLEDRIKHKKYCNPDEAIRYISQIASALTEVHNKRVLHLDISPSNILIDKNNNAQLIDFGVSLIYDIETGEVKQTSKLLAGKKSGFSPPEQTFDSLHHFSPPIDLYALGATFYNALTGKKPPESGLISSGSESLALPSSYNPKVSDYLDFFVLKAMNIRITDRFQTAEEFQDSLLNGEQHYTNAIRQGDVFYASGDYHNALSHFENAYTWINTNESLNWKISRCRIKISEEEEIKLHKDTQNNNINVITDSEITTYGRHLEETKLLPDNNSMKQPDTNTKSGSSNKNKLIWICSIFSILLIACFWIIYGSRTDKASSTFAINTSFENAIDGDDPNKIPSIPATVLDENTTLNNYNTDSIGFYRQKLEKYYSGLNQKNYDYIYELFAPQVRRLYNIKTTIGRTRVVDEAIKYAETYPMQYYEIIDFNIVESNDEHIVINLTNRYRLQRSEKQQERTGITQEVIVFNKNHQIIEMFNNNTP